MGTLSSGRSEARRAVARLGVLLFACSLSLITYLDRVCIMRVKGGQPDGSPPGIIDDLQFGTINLFGTELNANDQMGWVFAAFSVGYILFEIPAACTRDPWWPRRALLP